MSQTATLDPKIAERPLSEIVPSPKARKILGDAGLKNLGDVAARGFGSLHGMKGIGEATIQAIQKALGPALLAVEAPEATEEPEVEEGEHPIRLESPYAGFHLSVVAARKVEQPGGGYGLQESAYIRFQTGEAELTKRLWLLRALERDAKEIAKAMAAPHYAWRKAAVEWLRSTDAFKRGDFRILSD